MGWAVEVMAERAEEVFCERHGIQPDEDYELVDCACWDDPDMGCNPIIVYRTAAESEHGKLGLCAKCPDCGYPHRAPHDLPLISLRALCCGEAADDSSEESDHD